MRDVRDRLHRHIVGEGLWEPLPLVLRLEAREDHVSPTLEIRDRAPRPWEAGTRESRLRSNPSPNAPLLCRIMRNPYGLDPARFEHGAPRGRPIPIERQGRSRIVASLVAERSRVPFRSPAGLRDSWQGHAPPRRWMGMFPGRDADDPAISNEGANP